MDRSLLARRIIDFGLTRQDLSLGRDDLLERADHDALLQAAPGPAGLQVTQTVLGGLSLMTWLRLRR